MKQKKVLFTVLTAVIVILLAVIGVLVWKYQQASKDPNKQAKETSTRVVDKVGQLYMVPTGEEPTVALIQDKSKLQNQEFFKNAKDGDYLLIYKNAKIAMVYREKDNKLVNVGPINLDTNQGQANNTNKDQKNP